MNSVPQSITQTPQELLPHRAPMLLLTRCGTITGETVTASCTIGQQCRLFRLPDGTFGSWLILELMAQTIGIYAGLKNRAAHRSPQIGFLLGTRRFTVTQGTLRQGDVIDLAATCIFYAQSGFPSQFDCRASLKGQEIAQANLTVYQPESLASWKNSLS